MELRYYQKEACEAVINKYKAGVKKQALVMSTGSGKTQIFSTLALHFLKENKKKILILAHREELLQQAKNKLLAIDPLLKVEIEQGNNWANINSDIIIASAPTLGRTDSKRIQRFNPDDYQMIIVDEVHRVLGSTFINVLKYFRCYKGDKDFDDNDKLLLGVTATPSRSDGQGLDTVFDEIVYSYDIRKGIEDGFLSDIKAYSVTTASDLTGVGTAMGDFVVGELAKAVDNKERNALIVSSYKDIADGSQALAFAVNVEHAKSLSEYFNNAGVKSGCVLGETDNDERREILRKFDKKEIQVLCNVAVCTEGVDIPSIETVMMCRPTKSKIFFSQCLDLETEVLTPFGFKKYNEINVGDKVSGFDLKTQEIRDVNVESKVYRNLKNSENFYSIKTDSVDIRVTNLHRMIYDTKKNYGWMIERMEKLALRKDGYKIPCAGFEKNKGVPLTDDELRFIGWVMTDGCIHKKTKAIQISQSSHQPWIKNLEDCLKKCGFRYGKYISNSKSNFKRTADNIVFSISFGNPRRMNERHLLGWGYLEKYISKDFSELLFGMTEQQFDVLLEAINLGDGSKQRKEYISKGKSWIMRSYHICKGNKLFMDRLQMVAIKNGWRANLSEFNAIGYKPKYVLRLKKQNYRYIGGENQKDRNHFKKEKFKNEKCWCVNNELSTLIIRRNGKVCIVGNSIGRGLRLFPGKDHLKLIDFVDNTGKNSLISLPSLFGLPKGLKSKKEINVMDWVGKAEGLLKERPYYDLESIEDWSDENIQKIIKEVSLFEQAKLPEVVVRSSNLAWVEIFNGFSLSIPPKKEVEPVAFESSKLEDSKMKNEKPKMKNEKSEMVISKNMLDHYEVKYKEYIETDPKFTNKYQKWATKKIEKLGEFNGIAEALGCADSWVYKNHGDVINIVSQNSCWRSSKPTEKQVNLLKKLGVILPDGITKGECSVLIGKMLEKRAK